MGNSIKKENGNFFINGKKLPTHINGEKVLGVQLVERDGKIAPIIELEDTKHPPTTIIEGRSTITVQFKNEGGMRKLNVCIIARFRFKRDEWYTVDKDTYLLTLFDIIDNEFNININGEIISINKENKDYIIKKLS